MLKDAETVAGRLLTIYSDARAFCIGEKGNSHIERVHAYPVYCQE